MLLDRLEGIHGKFLLSSFRNASLAERSARLGWQTVEVRMASAMTLGPGRTHRQKVEGLTATTRSRSRTSRDRPPGNAGSRVSRRLVSVRMQGLFHTV